MDQSIVGFASAAPRRFRRDWALTVLWPALGCGGVAAALVGDDMRLEDGTFIFLLGMPALYWFIVGLLQGRLLGPLVSRPLAWAACTWGGGSLALIGGFVTFGALTVLIDAVTTAGYDFGHPFALAPFGVSGAVAGAILGLCQAFALRTRRGERSRWIVSSASAGALAFFVLWLGVNTITFISGRGVFDLAPPSFFAAIAAFLLAGALLHNLLTGIALERMLARRGGFDGP
jgi:hypothetical protein